MFILACAIVYLFIDYGLCKPRDVRTGKRYQVSNYSLFSVTWPTVCRRSITAYPILHFTQLFKFTRAKKCRRVQHKPRHAKCQYAHLIVARAVNHARGVLCSMTAKRRCTHQVRFTML